MSDAGLQHLFGLRNLESLNIWRCEHISRQALFIVATLLPKVQMDDSDDDDDESVRDLSPVWEISRGGVMRIGYHSDNSDDSADERL